MEIRIRKCHPSDKSCIVRFMEESQDYLASVDKMKRTRRMPGYGESYTRRLFKEIHQNDGIAYFAELEGRIVELVAGLIRKQSKEDLLECVPSKDGRILELFVDAQYRRQKVARMLMEKMEEYFKQNGCTVSRVEVFEPNVGAHRLYQKLGYMDRMIDLIKEL